MCGRVDTASLQNPTTCTNRLADQPTPTNKAKVKQLQEMAARNRANPSLLSQITSKLKEAQAELDTARAAGRAAQSAVNKKEMEKKWTKF